MKRYIKFLAAQEENNSYIGKKEMFNHATFTTMVKDYLYILSDYIPPKNPYYLKVNQDVDKYIRTNLTSQYKDMKLYSPFDVFVAINNFIEDNYEYLMEYQ